MTKLVYICINAGDIYVYVYILYFYIVTSTNEIYKATNLQD